jgi:pimeloyl-ACP methyl ester carboxylesterase
VSGDQFVTVMGARTRYRAEGAGPPLLMLHGIGASLEFWNWTTPALRDRWTCIALDFPGFGLSDLVDSALSPDGAGRFVLAFMDALAIERAAIMGSSLGGAIATMAAGAAPGRFSAVVLVDPGGFDTGLNVLMRLETIRPLGEAMMRLVPLAPALAVRDAFADTRRIPPDLIAIVRRHWLRPATGATFLRALRQSVTIRGVRPDGVAAVRAAAARITAPTLVVWGDRDRVIPPAQGPVAARVISGARLITIPGSGHVPMIEMPEAFNVAAAAFLDDVARMPHARPPVGAGGRA